MALMKELFCVESGLDPRSFQKNEGDNVLSRISKRDYGFFLRNYKSVLVAH
jgi:hypothetical protein